jgi:hypothetical protein
MVRGFELGVPGANRHIHPLQVEQLGQFGALGSVTYMPWLNAHHCILGNHKEPPWEPDPESIINYIENVCLDDARQPISDFVYLDIEPPSTAMASWYPGRGELWRDCLYIARQALGYKGMNVKLCIYDCMQGAWRRGQQPRHWLHGSIEPYVDALVLSLYGSAETNPKAWNVTIKLDMDMATRYMDWYNLAYCHGRPRVIFVWGFHKGYGGFYPLDWWQAYIEHLVSLCRPDDIFCWFGASNSAYVDQYYGPQIALLKEILGHDSETPQKEPDTAPLSRVSLSNQRKESRQGPASQPRKK